MRSRPRPGHGFPGRRGRSGWSTASSRFPASGRRWARSSRSSGCAALRDLLEHRPHRYEAPCPSGGSPTCSPRRRRRSRARSRSVSLRRPRAEPRDPAGAHRRRERRDRRRLVQPGVARGEAQAGHARPPARPAQARRLPGALLRPERRRGDRRLRAGLPGERGGDAEAAARARRQRAPVRARPAGPAARGAEGARSAAAAGGRARRAPPSALARRRARTARRRLAFDELLVLQVGARPRPGGPRGRPRPAARRARRAASRATASCSRSS